MEFAPGKLLRSAHLHFMFDLVVIRGQVLVGDRPVGADTVEGVCHEVTSMETVKNPGEMNCAPANAPAGIVGAELQGIRAGGQTGVLPRQSFSVKLVAGKIGLGVPKRPRLDAHHRQAGFGQVADEHSPGRTQAHNDHIYFFGAVFAVVHVNVMAVVVMVAVMHHRIAVFHVNPP